MGEKNSSLTRVQPVFDYINLDIQKLNQFFSLFDKKVSITSKILFCKYGENEASIKPPKELLLWCINNIDKLNSVEFEMKLILYDRYMYHHKVNFYILCLML